MRYEQIPNELFTHNRKRFMEKMEPGSIAVFNSNDIFPLSADSTMPFKQHTDIFHLSGADQEESILVLFPDAPDPKHREVLFVIETNPEIAVWEGAKLTKEKATEVSGIKTVYWLKDFHKIFNQLMADADNVYLNTNEHLRANTEVETREDRFIKWCKENFPAHSYKRSSPIMHEIRAVKHPVELDLMQKACKITEKGFRRLLDFIKPGVWEHEIEAELWHEFIRNRSYGFAYTPIVASGGNACVLHYTENDQEVNDGDLILMDFGAEYANYSSDMTRTIPANGRYTSRQKEIYNSVLKVKKMANDILKPGITLNEYHKEVGKMMESELVDLKLLDKTDIKNQNPDWPAYKKFFMHGTSHYIGLDTHDYGSWSKPIPENSVFTIEPGIYIPEEKIGIRLEDDYVLKSDKENFNLMGDIPIEIDEIEDLMNS
jgi:Xaa-Pro aminopeptidase